MTYSKILDFGLAEVLSNSKFRQPATVDERRQLKSPGTALSPIRRALTDSMRALISLEANPVAEICT